jgi:hypothetical protein
MDGRSVLTVYSHTKHTFCLSYKFNKTIIKYLKIFLKTFINNLFDKSYNF